MARKKPSPQGQRLLDLRRERPDATTAEIAKALGITASAVYQSEARLRAAGHLPKLRKAHYTGKRKPGRPRKTPTPTVPGQPPAIQVAAPRAAGNGQVNGSIEEHMRAELESNSATIITLETRISEAQAELEGRRARQDRLQKAQEALVV